MRCACLLLVACGSANTPQSTPVTPAPVAPAPSPDGKTPPPLVAKMFVKDTQLVYTVRSYQVDAYGGRSGGKPQRWTCQITDIVYLKELKALSSRMFCDDKGPLDGIMFSTAEGFWWVDKEGYLAAGFALGAEAMTLPRVPRTIASTGERNYTLEPKSAGWCTSEGFEHGPWSTQVMCFEDGVLVSGQAGKPGVYIEFKLAK